MGEKWIKKTTEQFKDEVYSLVGDEYTVLGDYKNNSTKILMRHNCEKCGNYEYEVRPLNFISKHQRCPKCFSTPRKTTEQFKDEVYSLVGDEYTVLGDYTTNKIKILMRHNCEKCGNYEYEVRPNDFKQGYRCPKCVGGVKYTLEDFKKEVKNRVGDEYTVLGDYKNTHTKILMRHNCEKCGNYEYEVKPNCFINGNRCPKCNTLINESLGSRVIDNYLINNEYNFKKEKYFPNCKNIKKLPFDFYLPDLNVIIEFDGRQHFYKSFGFEDKELELQKKRDKIKNNYCKENNITLLRISYKELNNIEKILDEFLLNANYNSCNKNIFIINEGKEIVNRGIYKDLLNDSKKERL